MEKDYVDMFPLITVVREEAELPATSLDPGQRKVVESLWMDL